MDDLVINGQGSSSHWHSPSLVVYGSDGLKLALCSIGIIPSEFNAGVIDVSIDVNGEYDMINEAILFKGIQEVLVPLFFWLKCIWGKTKVPVEGAVNNNTTWVGDGKYLCWFVLINCCIQVAKVESVLHDATLQDDVLKLVVLSVELISVVHFLALGLSCNRGCGACRDVVGISKVASIALR